MVTDPERIARLTKPYVVYLAMHDADVVLPVGTEFHLIAQLRRTCIGLYVHPTYGEIMIDTSDAEEKT